MAASSRTAGFFHMSETPKKAKPKTQAELRAARLQSALRDNLRRRKAANAPLEKPETPEDGQNGV